MKIISSKRFAVLSTLLLSCVIQQTLAEETAPADKAPVWTSNIEFGYVATSGNTDTTSINGGFAASYEVEKWKHALGIKTIFGSAKDSATGDVKTNAERYFIEGKTDYKYSETAYAFVLANYDDDRFSDNDYQISVSSGIGYSLIPSDTSTLNLEAGVGYRTTKKEAILTFPEETIDETIFRLALHYVYDITEHSKFEQKLSTDIGDDNTVTKSYTGLSANVAENLALKLSISATHQSDVRGDAEELDTVTAFTLVYNF